MTSEIFPRLAVRLRSTFPDADVQLVNRGEGLKVRLPTFPNWTVDFNSLPGHGPFHYLQSSIVLRYDCLQSISEADFLHLLAAENFGLRGATLLSDREGSRRIIRLRSTFVGQKGRTRDEAENAAIDTLSLLRFARLLEDRIQRSCVGDEFCYELYHSQYARGTGRNRFINYARSIFQGSNERVFGQTLAMFGEDYRYKVTSEKPLHGTVVPPRSTLVIAMRIPEDIPVLTCTASLEICVNSAVEAHALASKLNSEISLGHFEVSLDGSMMSFVAWKHLTNDLRYYGLDAMMNAVLEAEKILQQCLSPVLADSEQVMEAVRPLTHDGVEMKNVG